MGSIHEHASARVGLTDVGNDRAKPTKLELHVNDSPQVSIRGRLDAAAKRALDVGVAVLALVLASPIILACAVAIKIESPGPVLYRARRVGRGGREITILKFRKMTDGAVGPALTGDNDPRFTRLGRFLARTKLDELPQLWNVLFGRMSLVGPRPEDREFVDMHMPAYGHVLRVRPGITGLCQLAFAKESEILDPADRHRHYVDRILPQKIALDTLYVESRTLLLDIRILAWTFLPVLLRKDVAVNRASANLTLRRRTSDKQDAPIVARAQGADAES